MAAKRDGTEPSVVVHQPGAGGDQVSGTNSDRHNRIAEAAYYKAERRGFQSGGEVDDWLEAEQEIDSRGPEKGAKGEASARETVGLEAGVASTEVDRPDFPDLNETTIEHVEPDEVKKWASRLNVPADKLREAIKRVGPVVRDIKDFLESRP